MIAAQGDTSVSALAKQFLPKLGSGETETERCCASKSSPSEPPTGCRATIFAGRQMQARQVKLAAIGVAVRQNAWDDPRGDGAEPCDDRPRSV
jgi:hypothetical protein